MNNPSVNKSFSLKMNFQCAENWDGMTMNERGRLCGACDKTVIDFSLMSINQISEYFRTATGKTCGRIRKDQLKEIYMPVAAKRKAPWYNNLFVKIALTGILTFKLSDSKAQVKNPMANEKIQDNSGKKKNTVAENKTAAKKYISGKIIDSETKHPIIRATISIKNCEAAATTDSLGRFTIEVPENFQGKNVILNIYSHNHDEVQKTFLLSQLPKKNLVVALKYRTEIFMGDIAPEYIESH